MNKFRNAGFVAFFLYITLLISGCSGGGGTGAWVDPRIGFTYPDKADYSDLAWADAFKAAHDKFSREYGFTDWKGVDWPGLYDRFGPRIKQAQAAGDENAYYRALNEYINSIPDGHLGLGVGNSTVPATVGREMAGGGFGMAVSELDDWRVIAAAVVPNGQAAVAGITSGAEIVTWGGQPAMTAIGQIDPGLFPLQVLTGRFESISPQATLEYSRLEQARLLTRAPVGTKVPVVFKSPGSEISQTAVLTAVDDAGQTFPLLNFAKRAIPDDPAIDYRILPEGYGYIRVRREGPSNLLDSYTAFQQAMSSLISSGVPGIIVDLRGNLGGNDELAARMCGFFYAAPSFYEYQEYYDKRNGQFLRITAGAFGIVDQINIDPQSPYYGGPVVALVNPATISSGEGLAMCISRLPTGRVIGFHGTNGSFGMSGGEITMPGGYVIEYPFGRSLDKNGVIQLDSRNGIGGVAPDLRVPKTLENVLAFAAGTDVELQYAIKYLRGF